MWHPSGWWGPGWGLIGMLFMIGFWILVVVLIVALVRGRGGPPRGAPTTALAILEERYARGEIDRREFLERRAVLAGEAPESESPPEPTAPAD